MESPLNSRSSGILLHPTSLSGPFAHGDIGPASRRFIDFLSRAGQTWWQMLPIHPTGGCDSPYDSPSAFAGSEMLISIEDLVELGLLGDEDLRALPRTGAQNRAEFSLGKDRRTPLLRRAFEHFSAEPKADLRAAYEEFLGLNHTWVWDFALFSALRAENGFRSWLEFAPELRRRDPHALDAAHQAHRPEVLFHVFCQFLFHYQWGALRRYAHERRIKLMGDLPMFVAHDSADVWANQSLFFLSEDGQRTVQAGVPPDYFSESGQLWGNPLYRWENMRKDGYSWWMDRLRRELHKFDVVRLDHFIAFYRYWEVPMGAKSAKEGRYVEVPGHDFLRHARDVLGGLPFIAEDLGTVTWEVEQLRDTFNLPGMKILQFAFSKGSESYLPHQHVHNCVAYLGTHDNDTTRGWYEGLRQTAASHETEEAISATEQLSKIEGYTGIQRPADVCRQMLRTLMASPANTVILTIPDLLDQGTESRMNVPGVADGNWAYRIAPGMLTDEVADELYRITQATQRV